MFRKHVHRKRDAGMLSVRHPEDAFVSTRGHVQRHACAPYRSYGTNFRCDRALQVLILVRVASVSGNVTLFLNY